MPPRRKPDSALAQAQRAKSMLQPPPGQSPSDPELVHLPTCDRPFQRQRQQADSTEPRPISEVLALRDAPPPPPGYRYSLDGRLVPLEESTLPLQSRETQLIVCEILEKTGSLSAAADAIGVRPLALRRAIEQDPDFADDAEAAADRHRQRLYAAAYERAVVGHQVPIIGGKNKDEIVAYETRYSDSLMALMLKRHFVEFREATRPPQVNVDARSISVNGSSDSPGQLMGETLAALPKAKRDELRKLLRPEVPELIDKAGVMDAPTDDESPVGRETTEIGEGESPQ